MGAPVSVSTSPALVAITESFGVAIRSTAMGTVYALAVSVFGGTTQMIVAWLMHATHEPLAPFVYRVGAGAIGLTAMMLLPESAPARQERRTALLPPAALPG